MDMKVIGLSLIAVCICFYILVEVKKRSTFKSLLNHLKAGEYGEYLTLLNSAFVKFIYPKYNRLYMKLNAYMFMNDHDEINPLLDEMLKMKITGKQRKDLVSKAFNYYIEQNDKEHASQLLKEIDTFEDTTMKQDCHRIYDIFILKTYQYIDEMEASLPQATGMEKGFLEYLLSLQYEHKGDSEKSKYYLELSQKDMLPDELNR